MDRAVHNSTCRSVHTGDRESLALTNFGHDPAELRAHVRVFFKTLRGLLGGEPFPFLWTAELHKTGHGLHVHFAAGRFIRIR